MILLNLLPHREIAREKRKVDFRNALVLSAFVGAGLTYLWITYSEMSIESQNYRNQTLSAEIKKLDEEIKQVANLEAEIAALKARKKAVEDLQADRNLPVHLLAEFTRLIPEGMYLTVIKQEGTKITISGVAQSNQRISELLTNLDTRSPWLEKPELVEIVASTTNINQRDQRQVANFQMVVKQKPANSLDGASPASGASAASSLASGQP
jgi:type IV pilus assembly protein PilN